MTTEAKSQYTKDLEDAKDYAFDRLYRLNERYFAARKGFLESGKTVPRLTWVQELVLRVFKI